MFSHSMTFLFAFLSLVALTIAAPIPSSSTGLAFVHDVTVDGWIKNAVVPVDVSERRRLEGRNEGFLEFTLSEEMSRLEKERTSALIPLQPSTSLSVSARELTSAIKSSSLLTAPLSSSSPTPSTDPSSSSTLTTLLKSFSSPFQKRLQPFLSFPSSSSPSSHNLPAYIEALSSSEDQAKITRISEKRLVPFFSFQGARVGQAMGGELERERVGEMMNV